MFQRIPAVKIALLMCIFMHFSTLPVMASEMFEEMSTEDKLYVRGLISKVYPDKMQISVKPPRGKRIRISIDPDTILDGISQIDEFKKEQQVKVWYSINNDTNQAIKIVKIIELGC